MALSKSVLALITDGRGYITKEFLAARPAEWAREHMARRYGGVQVLDTDPADHFAHLCFRYLLGEYHTLRSWFTEDGKFSSLLHGRFIGSLGQRALGNGIGWDFRSDGDSELRMLQFKGTLVNAQRAAELLGPDQRTASSLQFAAIARLIRSAYVARAELHNWRPVDDKISGEDLAKRWVAHRTYTFLTGLGAEPVWAWDISLCRRVFGPIDEEPKNEHKTDHKADK